MYIGKMKEFNVMSHGTVFPLTSVPVKSASMPGPIAHTLQSLLLALIKIVLITSAVSYDLVLKGFEHGTFIFLVMSRALIVFVYLSYMIFTIMAAQVAIMVHKKLKGLAIITIVCVLTGGFFTLTSATQSSKFTINNVSAINMIRSIRPVADYRSSIMRSFWEDQLKRNTPIFSECDGNVINKDTSLMFRSLKERSRLLKQEHEARGLRNSDYDYKLTTESSTPMNCNSTSKQFFIIQHTKSLIGRQR